MVPAQKEAAAKKRTACTQILVKAAEDGPRDWTALEIQGQMVARDELKGLGGLPMGVMCRKGDSKTVSLTLGNQRLDGKVVDLKQPLAVMKRKAPEPDDVSGTTSYEIAGFIRRKIVFLHRPTVVTNSWFSPTKNLGTQEVA